MTSLLMLAALSGAQATTVYDPNYVAQWVYQGFGNAYGLAYDGSDLYIAQYAGASSIARLDANGRVETVASGFDYPMDIAVGGDGMPTSPAPSTTTTSSRSTPQQGAGASSPQSTAA